MVRQYYCGRWTFFEFYTFQKLKNGLHLDNNEDAGRFSVVALSTHAELCFI